jgi:xylulokinase
MFFLGLELSPNGTRAVVVDIDAAAVRAESWVPHEWIEGLPQGYREQDPVLWIGAVDQAVAKVMATLGDARERIGAIGVAGPQRGMVLLDEADQVVRPAKLSGDNSASRQAEELARAFGGAPGLIELAGKAPGAESAAAELLWLKQHEPVHFQRAAQCFTVQDFINYWLSGERATEAGSASTTGLLDVVTRSWSGALTDFIDPSLKRLLPDIRPADQSRGVLRPELARQWGLSNQVQIGPGSAAPLLSALSAGCVANGTVALELGATGVIAGVGGTPVIDFRGELESLCSASGSWIALGLCRNTASAPELLRRHYGWSHFEFEANVSSVVPGANGLTVLPYFSGESMPFLLDGCGVIHGLTAENFTPAHLARATAEGVALGLGYAMSRLRDLGFEPQEVRMLGPGALSAVNRQLLADVLGAPVIAVSSRQGAAIGAAMQAAVGFFRSCGEQIGFPEIASYLVSGDSESVCEPIPANYDLYQELMARQQYLVDTLHPAGFL